MIPVRLVRLVSTGPKGDTGATGADGAHGAPGANGQDGQDGQAGESAYQAWLDQGNTGTEAAFVASLKGAQGDPGPQGPAGDSDVRAGQITVSGSYGDVVDFTNAMPDANYSVSLTLDGGTAFQGGVTPTLVVDQKLANGFSFFVTDGNDHALYPTNGSMTLDWTATENTQ